MAAPTPRLRLLGKGPKPLAEAVPRAGKRPRDEAQETAPGKDEERGGDGSSAPPNHWQEEERAVVPRAGGRGLKSVQSCKELAVNASRTDGSRTERTSKIKEQKLFTARSNSHVETKVMTEDTTRTTKRDGTLVVSRSTTVKKVHYV